MRDRVKSTRAGDRRRFRNRRNLRRIEIVSNFESQPASHHIREAMGVIERVRDEGRQFWQDDADELHRWHEGCTDLWAFLNNLGHRRHIDGQTLETASREFIQAFEHTVYRIQQLLHGVTRGTEVDRPEIDLVFEWIEVVFRMSMYGLIAYWIDDKTEERLTRITVNLRTGAESHETEVLKRMRIPKRYRSSARLRRDR